MFWLLGGALCASGLLMAHDGVAAARATVVVPSQPHLYAVRNLGHEPRPSRPPGPVLPPVPVPRTR